MLLYNFDVPFFVSQLTNQPLILKQPQPPATTISANSQPAISHLTSHSYHTVLPPKQPKPQRYDSRSMCAPVIALWCLIVAHSFHLHLSNSFVSRTHQYTASDISVHAHHTTRVAMMSKDSTTDNSETIGQMLGGLVFLKTADRKSIVDFYTNRLGMTSWLDQPNINIWKHGNMNMILGFHQIFKGCTRLYPSKEQVDEKMYNELEDIADGKPRHNERYQINISILRERSWGKKSWVSSFIAPTFWG